MQKLILLLTVAFSLNAFAQGVDKTVTLVVSGQGKTQDEAKQNALRNAIEQAFGTFISSKTEILNDNLIKDEIVSVANGNIQKFEVISEVQIPNGSYATSLKATVSVTKLTTFIESKGIIVEFKGSLFAFNVFSQQLYEKNEITALENLKISLNNIADKCFDYKIKAKEPRSVQGDNSLFIVPLSIECYANDNLQTWLKLFKSSIIQLGMINSDVSNYQSINKKVYPFNIVDRKISTIYFRTDSARIIINEIFAYIVHGIQNFEFSNGNVTKNLYSFKTRERDWYTRNEQSEIQQMESNYLMSEFNYINLERRGPNVFDGCYPCLYHNDLFYLMNRGNANRAASMKYEISFSEISSLDGKAVAIYQVNDKLTIEQIRLITEYKIYPK